MNSKGFALSHIILIIAALCIGIAAYLISKTNDSPVEQAVEAVLKTEGIDIDFSPDESFE